MGDRAQPCVACILFNRVLETGRGGQTSWLRHFSLATTATCDLATSSSYACGHRGRAPILARDRTGCCSMNGGPRVELASPWNLNVCGTYPPSRPGMKLHFTILYF